MDVRHERLCQWEWGTALLTRNSYGLIVAAALIVGIWLSVLYAYSPHALTAANGGAEGFSAVRALNTLREILPDSHPHPIGSAADSQVRTRIVHKLRELGYEPQLQEGAIACSFNSICGSPVNIVVRLGEKGSPVDASSVLLAAHYDSVPAGPGVSDDGAGVATALEIARIMRHAPGPHHPVILLLDEGEESGELGAQLFVQAHPWAHQVKAAINLEARGTSGASLMFETGSANGWLMGMYAAAIRSPLTNSIWYSVYSHMSVGTDFRVFRQAGYQGFNFAFIGNSGIYHTARDDLAHVDLRTVQQQGDQALSALLALANSDVDHPSTDQAEYFDVLGRVLVRLPTALMSPIATGALVGLVLFAIVFIRRRIVRLSALLWSAGAVLLAMPAALVLAMAVLRGIRLALADDLPPFLAHHESLIATSIALVAATIGLISLLARRRTSFWSLLWAIGVLDVLLGAVLARLLPGTSYLPLLPGLIGTVIIILRLFDRPRSGVGKSTCVMAQLAARFLLLLPVAIELYDALGSASLPLLTVLLTFGALPLVCILIESGARVQSAFTLGASTFVVLGFILVVALPIYSSTSPQRLNLMYVLDGSIGNAAPSARWLLQSDARRIPALMRSRFGFAPLRRSMFEWESYEPRNFTAQAAAPLLDLSPPRLHVLSAEKAPGGISYRLSLASAQRANALTIAFSPGAQIHSVLIRVAGTAASVPEAKVDFDDSPSDWQTLKLAGMSESGAELAFTSGNKPFDVVLADKAYYLPDSAYEVAELRPHDAIASHDGDVTIVTSRIHLPGL